MTVWVGLSRWRAGASAPTIRGGTYEPFFTGIMEKKTETIIIYWGYIGIMEKKMEPIIVYWGYIGIMENKMETTIIYFCV